jgi:hypothetical protein
VTVTAQIHPFSNERTTAEYPPGKSLRELLFALDPGIDPDYCRVQADGAIITDFDYVPPDGSVVLIKVVPGKGGRDKIILGAVMAAVGVIVAVASLGTLAPFGAILIGTGVSMMLGGAYMLLYEPPDIPDIKNNAPQARPGIQGAKNQARPYGYVPVLFGRSLITPDLAADYFISIENNKEYLTQLFCCGYNAMRIDRDSFKLGETKLIELSATKDINSIIAGTDPVVRLELINDGTPSGLYPQLVKQVKVSRQLKQTLDDGSSGAVIVTTPADTVRIDLNFAFNNGLFGLNDEGDVVQIGVYISVWIKPADADDTAYALFGYISGSHAVTGSSKKALYRSFSGTVAPGVYTVKVQHDGTAGGASHRYDAVYLLSLNAFRNGPPVSDDTARTLQLIALKVKATDRISGVIDNFNFIADAFVPAWKGSDFGSGPGAWTPALTKNPAAAFLYALRGPVNRRPVEDAHVDWQTLEAWYTWCETHRYYCSAVLSNKTILSELLKQICYSGRAEPVRRDGLFSVIQDIERPFPVQLFTPKNTVDYFQTLGFPDIPQAMEMQFVDESSGYQQDVRKVFNTPSGEQENMDPADSQTVPLWGVTSARQAFLLGRYQYACLTNRPRVHTISVDFEYLMSGKGDRIKYSGDTAMSGIAWGRIKELITTGNAVTALVVDELILMEAEKTYSIRIRTAQNKQAEYAAVTDPGYSNRLLLDDPIPPSFETSEGDLYAFGETGTVSLDLLIVDIDPVGMDQARLKCVDYAPEIFGVDDPGYVVPPWDPHVSVGGAVDSGFPQTPPPAYLDNVLEKIVETQVKLAARPTYTEIVEGFTRSGLTIVPASLSLTASGGFRFVALSWAKQTNLSNLKEYQIQVSEDAASWYAPRFDGLGPEEAPWRGEPDAVFATAATMVVHPNIPPAGTPGDPRGRFLYYRVRQRTVLDAFSEWSDTAGAETKLADTGDYGVNSISANALKTAELLAVFAKLSESLIVDPRYGISSENAEWADGDSRATLNAREIAFQFFTERLWATMARLGLEGVEASQLYSADKLFITNDDMASRRSRGYDIGSPLLSDRSRVAHLDLPEELSFQGGRTWVLDQNGAAFLEITGTGSLEGAAEGIPLLLKAVAPYATETRALHGNFRLRGTFEVSGAWTLDFWLFYYWNENQRVVWAGNDNEWLQLAVHNAEPYLNDEPSAGVWLNDEPSEGVWLNEIKDAGVRVDHFFAGVTSGIDLLPEELQSEKWYHIGITANGTSLKLFINNKVLSWASQNQTLPVTVDVNPNTSALDGEHSLMMADELMFDPSAAEELSLFNQNSMLKRPWGKLDDRYPWAIINVKDPRYFKSNIFQSPDFAAAVLALLDRQDFADAVRALLNGGTP